MAMIRPNPWDCGPYGAYDPNRFMDRSATGLRILQEYANQLMNERMLDMIKSQVTPSLMINRDYAEDWQPSKVTPQNKTLLLL